MDILSIDNLGIDRVLKRGTGIIVEKQSDALLVKDTVSGAYMLACDERETGRDILKRRRADEMKLLMVSDYSLGTEAFETFGFSKKIECYQVAYYGKPPVFESPLTVRKADENDLPMLVKNYSLISPEEIAEVVKRRSMLLGYIGGNLIGFIGEHLEGSMGLLYVFPEYRNKGYGTALQERMIADTIEKGYVPFGQVEKSNQKSLSLQKKLGMTVSENLIVWMWR